MKAIVTLLALGVTFLVAGIVRWVIWRNEWVEAPKNNNGTVTLPAGVKYYTVGPLDGWPADGSMVPVQDGKWQILVRRRDLNGKTP